MSVIAKSNRLQRVKPKDRLWHQWVHGSRRYSSLTHTVFDTLLFYGYCVHDMVEMGSLALPVLICHYLHVPTGISIISLKSLPCLHQRNIKLLQVKMLILHTHNSIILSTYGIWKVSLLYCPTLAKGSKWQKWIFFFFFFFFWGGGG